MKARALVFRVAMAVAAIAAALTVGAPAAHAATPQSATVSLECEPIAGSQFQEANWHVHLSLADDAPYGYSFLVVADFNPGQAHYLKPGESLDVVEPGRDGLGSKITVAADNYVLEKISTVVCNPPLASVTISCPNDGGTPWLNYFINNPSPSTYNFVVHESGGVDLQQQLKTKTASFKQFIGKGTQYHGWITINGDTIADLAGVATCGEVEVDSTTTTTLPPTSTTTVAPTTTTTLAPTTTTTVPAETTTVPADDPTTTTTVPATLKHAATTTTSVAVSSHATPATAGPTTTSAPVATTASDTLPFTGGNAMPLVALGSVFVGLGVLLTGRRRRLVQ